MTMKKWLCFFALLFLLAGCSQPQGGEGDSHGGDSSSQEESSPEEKRRLGNLTCRKTTISAPQRLQLLHEALADSSVYAMVTAKDGVIVMNFIQRVMRSNQRFPAALLFQILYWGPCGHSNPRGALGRRWTSLLSEYLPQVRGLGPKARGRSPCAIC